MADPFDYIESRADADELISDFGTSVSVRRDVAGGTAFDPTLTPTDYGTMACKIEFSWKQMQGGNINAGDERWLVAAGPLSRVGVVEILPTDRIVIGGVARTIVNPNPLQPAGIVVMFDCQVRI